MKITGHFVKTHPDLFEYIKSDEVHPHDHLVNRVILRFLPEWVTPNRVTTLRVILTPVVFFLILLGYYRFGVVFFLFVAFTDVIDGTLARTRHKITKFGIMFDPLADKLLIGSMVLLLVFQHFHFLLGIAILGLEIAFIAIAFVYKYKFKTVRMANLWGKIKMVLQVLAVSLTLMALLLDFPLLITAAAWVFGLAIGFAIVSLFAHGI